MEEQVDRLVQKVQAQISSTPRLLIAISGIPGSAGKTSIASTVVSRLNSLHPLPSTGSPPFAVFIPMDGYHLTRAQLSAMADPKRAHARRGAEFTFDGAAFLELVRAVREQLPMGPAIYAPSFDHAVKDPVENDIRIDGPTRVVAFEGNYLSLHREPWRAAARLMHERWFVEVEKDVAERRLVGRHVKSGVAANEEEARERVRENDMVNGDEIVELRGEVDEVVVSKEDEGWMPAV